MTFSESGHPRAADGTFITKRGSEPDIILEDDSAERTFLPPPGGGFEVGESRKLFLGDGYPSDYQKFLHQSAVAVEYTRLEDRGGEAQYAAVLVTSRGQLTVPSVTAWHDTDSGTVYQSVAPEMTYEMFLHDVSEYEIYGGDFEKWWRHESGFYVFDDGEPDSDTPTRQREQAEQAWADIEESHRNTQKLYGDDFSAALSMFQEHPPHAAYTEA